MCDCEVLQDRREFYLNLFDPVAPLDYFTTSLTDQYKVTKSLRFRFKLIIKVVSRMVRQNHCSY